MLLEHGLFFLQLTKSIYTVADIRYRVYLFCEKFLSLTMHFLSVFPFFQLCFPNVLLSFFLGVEFWYDPFLFPTPLIKSSCCDKDLWYPHDVSCSVQLHNWRHFVDTWCALLSKIPLHKIVFLELSCTFMDLKFCFSCFERLMAV